MSRAKVKPTQLTRRSDRQGSIPKGEAQQPGYKRPQKSAIPKSRGAKRAKHPGGARTPSMR